MNHDLSASRAILIGNASYRSDSGIPDLPAATGSVTAMATLLTGELCEWPADRIIQALDIAAPHELARRLTGAVREVQDVLLLYYVGHGLRTPKGQLALTLSDSDADPALVGHTAILYENIAEILRGSAADTKLVILDCCHAELGDKANVIFQDAGDLADAYPMDGLYCIWGSKTYEKARTPAGGALTYFTANFIATVQEGIPRRPEFLAIDQIFLQLRDRMARQGLPVPVESGTRGARLFPFARNAAFSPRDVAAETAPVMPLGPRSALVIATETYADTSLFNLRSPAQDAADMADVLGDPRIGGFDVITLIDQTANEMRIAIDDFVSDRNVKDVVLIYISGHTIKDTGGRLHFAAVDTRISRLASTGIDARWLNQRLHECRARQLIVILDCNYSGAFTTSQAEPHDFIMEAALPQRTLRTLEDDVSAKFPPGRGRIVLSSSSGIGYSFEESHSEARGTRSLFTAGLVEGLRTGKADIDHDGYISVDDAYAFAFEYVQQRDAGQTPQLSSMNIAGKVCLAQNPAD
jgi:uncharacterized caspase-like protein